MVDTIRLMVHEQEGQQNRRLAVPAFYVAGSTVGGATAGFTVGLAAAVARGVWPVTTSAFAASILVGLVGLLFALRDLNIVASRLPQVPKQVPRKWKGTLHPYWAAALYGSVLGAGMLTRITFASVHFLLLVCALLPNFPAATGAFALFGFSRALPVVAAATMPVLHVDIPAIGMRRYMSLARVANGSVLAATSLLLITYAFVA
ncbi:MAG TPA: hypothetical protein VNM43_02380 [Dehalococcoidia bacterium]|nr:hypothetical protein [Dehalococcoidia bacterium]